MPAWFVIAAREYVTNVRRKEFILITIGMPLLILFFAGAGAVGTGVVVQQIMHGPRPALGIYDRSGLLRVPATGANVAGVRITPVEGIDSGRELVKRGTLGSFVVVEPDYLSNGSVTIYRKSGSFLSRAEAMPVGRILARLLISRVGAAPALAARIVEPAPRVTTLVPDKTGRWAPRSGAREAARFIVPYLFSILLVTSIFISASYLLRGISDEKENRIIEVILSSVTPDELLRGKLIGSAAVGLTQVAIWMGLAALPAMIMFSAVIRLSAASLAGVVLFFALGYALYATLMAGLGALGTSFRETQQISGVVSLMAFFPFVLLTIMVEMPNGGLARALSFFPFTAPTAMVLRLTAADVPGMDVALSALSLVVTTWLLFKLSAKLFRLGLLIYGKRPTVAETFRWLRQT